MKKTYITTGKNSIVGVEENPITGHGVHLELEPGEGERLVRLGACYPQGYQLAVATHAPAQMTFFDAIKKALENKKIIASGAPDITYLEGLLGRDIAAKERDDTWAEYKTSMDIE